jgi:hypothetical protein
MIKIAAKDLKPLDMLLLLNGRSKEYGMVKTVSKVDDNHVKVTLYGRLAVYHENDKMLQITAAPARKNA